MVVSFPAVSHWSPKTHLNKSTPNSSMMIIPIPDKAKRIKDILRTNGSIVFFRFLDSATFWSKT